MLALRYQVHYKSTCTTGTLEGVRCLKYAVAQLSGPTFQPPPTYSYFKVQNCRRDLCICLALAYLLLIE